MLSTDYEKILLALMGWREASGEGQNGMLAVMNVAMNRSRAWKQTVSGIITSLNQFTSISVHSDPETTKWPHPNDPNFLFCLQRADFIYDGKDADITHGALYYENPATADSPWYDMHIVNGKNPDGTPSHPVTVTIGHQVFRA